MTNLGLTKYFPLTSLPLVISACAALFACKPGGERPDAVVSSVSFDASSDLRALLVSESKNCVYVADYYQKIIHCVDLTTHSNNTSAAFSTTGKPVAMAMTNDNATLVVATEDASTGSAIEIFTFGKTSPSPCTLPGPPNSVAVTDKNYIYVGVGGTQSSIYSCGTAAASIRNATPVTQLNGYNRIAGLSNDGTLMFTVSPDMSTVGFWNIHTAPTNVINANNMFGALSNYGWIEFQPNDHEAFVFTDGTATSQNTFPTYTLNTDNTLTGPHTKFAMNFLPNALAFSPDGKTALITHGIKGSVFLNADHELSVPDLHIFDASTGAALGTIPLSDYVHQRGIAVGDDGTIYLLLGEQSASSIAVIPAPK